MSNPRAIGIIPARFGAQRFPGKPLADIAGKTMVRRVYEQALKANLAAVVVATDDNRIRDEVEGFGGRAIMTGAHHPSGTDRCQEAYTLVDGDFDVVVNIQGDEPFIRPEQINQLIGCFERPQTQIATLVKQTSNNGAMFDENRVKVVLDQHHNALYFSRSAIPHCKGAERADWVSRVPVYLHIGLYAYRPHILDEIAQLSPTPLEQAESLEQLRWLEHGYHIRVAETDYEPESIDHPDDLKRLLQRLQSGESDTL